MGAAATCDTASPRNTGLVCAQTAPAHEGTGRRVVAYTYDRFGQRLSELSPKAAAAGQNDRAMRYTYYADADRDLSGRTSAGGWLKAVTDPDGQFVTFGYDAAGNVVRTWDRNATAGHSNAEFPGTVLTPPSGRYAETRYGGGEPLVAFADPWRFVRAERAPTGDLSTHTTDANGNVTVVRPPRGTAAGSGDFDVTADYDANDNLVARVTPAGRRAMMTDLAWTNRYDPFDNVTAQVDPNAHATVVAYDGLDRPTTTRWTRTGTAEQAPASCAEVADAADAPLTEGRHICQTSAAYDGLDNPLAETDADGATTTTRFDAVGRPTLRTAPRADGTLATTRTGWLYDPDSNVTDVCAPREFTEGAGACDPAADPAARRYSTHVVYDFAGAPVTTTRWRDAATPLRQTVTYDPDGNPATVTNPRGITTTVTHDLLGRRLAQAVPRAPGDVNTTRWRYDPVGNVTAVTWPDPTRGNPDDAANDRVTAYSWDANNRLLDEVTAADDPGAAAAGVATGERNRRTRRAYDPNGNVVVVWGPRAFTTSVTAPNDRFKITTTFDSDDRPIAQLVPRAGGDATIAGPADDQHAQCPTGADGYPADTSVCRTQATYDPVGNRLSLVLPTAGGDANRRVERAYTDDDLGAAMTAPSPEADGQRVDAARYVYDGSGRPTRTTDALGHVDTMSWSADGLLLRQASQAGSKPDGEPLTHTTSFGYDADGNQTSETDALGRVTTTGYTPDGLVARLTAPLDRVTTYDYDRNGNVVRFASPNANRDADAANTANTPTIHTWTEDDLLSTVTVPVSADGSRRRRTSYGYDDAGRKTSQSVAVVDAAGAVVEAGGVQRFEFLATDELAAETGRDGESITTSYDAAGNRVRITDSTGGGSTITASYYLDDLVRTVDDGDRDASYSYDGAGQLVVRSHDDAGGQPTPTSYAFNDAGRAVSAVAQRTGQDRQWEWSHEPAKPHPQHERPHRRVPEVLPGNARRPAERDYTSWGDGPQRNARAVASSRDTAAR